MSIVQSPVMGQMRKSFANVNTYVHRGQIVISAKAFNRKDANSGAQQAHRAGFKLISDVGQMLGGFLERGFPLRPEKLSAYNLFVQLNLTSAIDFSGEKPVIDYGLLKVSKGSLSNVDVQQITFANSVLSLQLNTNQYYPNVDATDKIQVLAGTASGQLFATATDRGTDEVAELTLNMPGVVVADIAFVYIFCYTSDGRKSSNSLFTLPG